MEPVLHRPRAPLDDFVDCMYQWDGDPTPAPRERVLPAGTVDLIINVERDELRFVADEPRVRSYSGAVLCGAQARYLLIEPPANTLVVGVHFKPGGAFPFVQGALHALTDTQVDLDLVFGPHARELRARLYEAPTAAARFRLLETWLLARAHRPLAYHPAVAEALWAFEDPALRSVAAVCERTGYSAKGLIALWRAHVGLTPKAYWRVRRFQAALRHLERSAAWMRRGAQLALELGYCDQAHLSREFHGLSGLSPSGYLAHEIGRTNHVPLRG